MSQLQTQYLSLRKQILEQTFSRMNEMQRQAMFRVHGPVLILAGAGSGKTTVMVNRIAYMVRYGNAYESDACPDNLSETDLQAMRAYLDDPSQNAEPLSLLADHPIAPWNILAITFTNKAANELKSRLQATLGDAAEQIYAGTFHAECSRILRREIDRLGYTSRFTIYDTDDGARVIKDCLKALDLDEKVFPAKSVLQQISRSKDQMLSPADFRKEAGLDFRKQAIAQVYERYQEQLRANNALDFDDLILLTVRLFEEHPDVLSRYQDRFRYILVDEYQDTNHAQYRLISLLSANHNNLCVVGDDDQSIYRFRGATIENILLFENQFENAFVVRLEQNYRSTQTILDAANQVIQNNYERKGKNLWTTNGVGEKITLYKALDESDEAQYITNTILANVKNGRRFSDHAVLYRMNAQSNTIERSFLRSGIAYRIVGGIKFFERKEVKDVLSYMCLVNNPQDTLRLKRIINEPKRGIGAATLRAAEMISEGTGVALFDILRQADSYPTLSKKAGALRQFTQMIDDLRDLEQQSSLDDFYDALLERSGYQLALIAEGEVGKTRLENVDELKSNIVKYIEETDEPTLSGFLEEVALYTDLDSLNDDADYVTMMTVHAAKGLEFPCVFLPGMEESIFPGRLSYNTMEEMQEERRLAYVAITRAKERLYILSATQRMLFGQTGRNPQSRFVGEIPPELIDVQEATPVRTGYGYTGSVPPRPRGGGYVPSPYDKKPKTEKAAIAYTVGDRVSHTTFGEGTVTGMTPMANDIMVEVQFDRIGTKKLMANFAKLKKI